MNESYWITRVAMLLMFGCSQVHGTQPEISTVVEDAAAVEVDAGKVPQTCSSSKVAGACDGVCQGDCSGWCALEGGIVCIGKCSGRCTGVCVECN